MGTTPWPGLELDVELGRLRLREQRRRGEREQTAALKGCATSARPAVTSPNPRSHWGCPALVVDLLHAFARLELRLVLLVGVVVPGDPGEAHLVDRAVAAADPVPRIGIALGRRVVVPADHVQHRARRIDRRHIVGIDADEVPVEAPVGAADLLGLVVRINQLDALPLAARVHVRLERGDAAGLVEARVAVAADVGGAARDVERLGRLAELLRVDDVLRHVPLRVEDDAELRLVGDFLADRVIVEVELDLRAGLQQAARAFGEQIAVLADGELVEEFAGVARCCRRRCCRRSRRRRPRR